MNHDGKQFSADAAEFLFAHIDSVEQLEVMLLVWNKPGEGWSADAITRELRSNPASIALRLKSLESRGLISRTSELSDEYVASPSTGARDRATIAAIAELYRSHKHHVLEIIFSPLKKARDCANAFKLGGPSRGKGEDRG